jgi:hypothetical protein
LPAALTAARGAQAESRPGSCWEALASTSRPRTSRQPPALARHKQHPHSTQTPPHLAPPPCSPASLPCSFMSANDITSAQMKPRSKSEWMAPAACGALVCSRICQQRTCGKGRQSLCAFLGVWWLGSEDRASEAHKTRA